MPESDARSVLTPHTLPSPPPSHPTPPYHHPLPFTRSPTEVSLSFSLSLSLSLSLSHTHTHSQRWFTTSFLQGALTNARKEESAGKRCSECDTHTHTQTYTPPSLHPRPTRACLHPHHPTTTPPYHHPLPFTRFPTEVVSSLFLPPPPLSSSQPNRFIGEPQRFPQQKPCLVTLVARRRANSILIRPRPLTSTTDLPPTPQTDAQPSKFAHPRRAHLVAQTFAVATRTPRSASAVVRSFR